MFRIISALLIAISSSSLWAQTTQDVGAELVANAPDRHVVVSGDTLWGIAGKFLKDPYRWNDLWKLNTGEIKNPHWIYPGQVVVLDRSGASPALRLLNADGSPASLTSQGVEKLQPRIRDITEQKAIPAIPLKAISPFLNVPLVTDEKALSKEARIIGAQDARANASVGDLIYVTGLSGKTRLWQVFRPGKRLVDPVSGDTLGHEAIMLGTAQLEREGDPATLRLIAANAEISAGDRLVPAPAPDIVSYPQRLPTQKVDARIVSIDKGAEYGGRYSVISISRGASDGIQVGYVLALYHLGETVRDRNDSGNLEAYTLPDERIGLLYVFRVFDKVSYALVMQSDRQISTGDVVRNP
ncbi:MAG: LysM peptidoglycan-binding domain-containing protein [Proteobacteria bacterium]|nr:LysM peptidoglycan-binding domain-containing protein [Pseudomonadota bacterium]HQR03594.1 LysM domain-containing protein [Rhodocyclaceae bacterium]